jgi:hypothetical protein
MPLDFVGRTEHIRQILGGTDGTSAFFGLAGIPGIGKTSLLSRLAEEARARGGTALYLSAERYVQPGRGRVEPSPDDPDEYRQFRILLRDAMHQLPDGTSTDVLNYLTRQGSRAHGGFIANPGSQLGGRAPTTPAEVRAAVSELVYLAQAAVNDLARTLAASGAPFVVLVDDFHALAGRPLGRWLVECLGWAEGTIVVVAHQQLRDADRLALPAFAVPLPLGNLTLEDVTAYLKSHPGVGPDVAEIVGPVWDFTGGHPQALALVADLIEQSEGPDKAVERIRQLGALQGGLAHQLTVLVDRILGAIDDHDLRDALDCLCVVRRFDRPLLQCLLEEPEERRARAIVERLRRYSFVVPAFGGQTGDGSFLMVSSFVRRCAEDRLSGVDRDRLQALHARAADYYQHLLLDEDGAAADGSYESWFRYEEPEWQTLEKEWLYHLSHLTKSGRKAGRIGIARVFLDAFWWWGCYLASPFCEDVLADWYQVVSDSDDDRAWGRSLRTLYDQYPKGWRKSQAPPQQWHTVRRALTYLWDRGGFGSPHLDDPEMRHLRGIIDLFRADAARFVSPDDPEVDTLLDDAATQFAANGDGWDLAWVDFTRAEVEVDRGHPERAVALVRQTVAEHPDLDDHELTANLHRVCADAAWSRGEIDAALDAHARAVLHAYKFQLKRHVDDYTAAFQQEMVDRCVERLLALHEQGRPDLLRAAGARIRAFFGPYWAATGTSAAADPGTDVPAALAAGRTDDVARALFPPGPTLADLDRAGSDFELIGVDVVNRMAEELARAPGTPLPDLRP